MFEFKGMRDIDARLGVNVLGEFPTVRLLSFCLCLRTPFTPGQWYGSHFWLPATPSLFLACTVDSRIRRSRTRYCPEFALEAMTSILGSSSFEGVKEFFVFYFVIVGNVKIGVKEWNDANEMMNYDDYWPGMMIESMKELMRIFCIIQKT